LLWAIILKQENNITELLAKIKFLQEAPKMEIAKSLWYKE